MAEPVRLRYDGVESYLKTALTSESTTIEFDSEYMGGIYPPGLTHDGGVAIPPIAAGSGDYLPLSILDNNYRLSEIVWLTEYAQGSPTGTIARHQEGTSAKEHPVGRKIVHAATVTDFVLLQDHNHDANAHPELIERVQQMIDAAIAAHNVDPNAHSYLARTNNPTFTGTAVFEHITLNGNMTVNAGAQIIVNANGSITINGTITIHGKQLVISKDAPINPANDLVWIKTFG